MPRPRVLATIALVGLAPIAVAEGQRAPTSVRVLPVLGSAPETGLQYGATVLRVSRAGPSATTRSSADQVLLTYTAKKQLKASARLDRWTENNTWRLRANAEYIDFPLPYYGVGDATPREAEEWYRSTGPAFQAMVQRQLQRNVFASTGYRFAHTRVKDVSPTGALRTGAVEGSTGGDVSQVLGALAWDSRDNPLSARAGTLLALSASGATEATGSDYTFGRYTLDARRYVTLRGSHVFAAQALLETTSGRPPFDQMALVGADTSMRGYTRGRYRDRQMVSAQVEYRSPFVRRFGVVAFAGGGTVAPTVGHLADGAFLPSFGAGVRYLLLPAERTTIRVDLGGGRKSSGLYVAFNEAF